jgi:hypothetical protein
MGAMTLPHFEPRLLPGCEFRLYSPFDVVHDWWFNPDIAAADPKLIEEFCAYANESVKRAGEAGAVDSPVVEHASVLEA